MKKNENIKIRSGKNISDKIIKRLDVEYMKNIKKNKCLISELINKLCNN